MRHSNASSDSPPPSRPSVWAAGIAVENVLLIAAAALLVGFLAGRTGLLRRELKAPHPSPATPHEGAAAKAPSDISLEEARERVAALNDAQQLVSLGNDHYDRQQYAIAAAAYERAVELGIHEANVYTDLGAAYRYLGQPEQALEAFRKAQAVDPRHVQSYFNMGLVYWDLGDTKRTLEAWDRCLQLKPDEKLARMIQHLREQVLAESPS